MFKRYIHGVIVLLFLLAGCTADEIFAPSLVNGDKINVTFTVNVPAYRVADTRASVIDENNISQLWLLVFDGNGNYLYKEKASLPTTSDGTFSVELIDNEKEKIIHFIANYDCSVIDDAIAKQKDERELVTAMSVSGNQLTMWQRVELPNGIKIGAFPTPINLIRNMAKITVIDSNSKDAFSITGFSVHRMPTKGTVAPFDTRTYSFAESVVTEPAGSTYTASTPTDAIRIVTGTAGTHVGISPSSSEYLFERENSKASLDYTCVVLHGKYNNSAVTTYYKIDIVDSNNLRLDILRNHWYQLTVNEVLRAGYPSVEDALSNTAANNNSTLDVTIEKYPLITNGVSSLEVERNEFYLSVNRGELNTWAKFIPDITKGTVDNSGLTVEVVETDPSNPLIDGEITLVKSTGRITANINPLSVSGTERIAYVIVKGANNKDVTLSRTIKLIQKPLFTFDPVRINGVDPAENLEAQNDNAQLTFNIPSSYPVEQFPLQVKIFTEGLYPAQSGLFSGTEDGKNYYMYTATQSGIQTVNFKTTLSTSSESLRLKAVEFIDGLVGYNVVKTYGHLTYTYEDATTWVPYTEEFVSVSVGDIAMRNSTTTGEYDWYHSTQLLPSTSAIVSYRYVMSDYVTRVFSDTLRIDELMTIPDINLTHTQSISKGTITYYKSGGGAKLNVPAGAVVIPNIGHIHVIQNGVYEFDYPVDNPSVIRETPVSFTYYLTSKVANTEIIETYVDDQMNLGQLIDKHEINLASTGNYTITGNIYYRTAMGDYLVPFDSSVSSSKGEITIYADGRYRLILPSTTSENESLAFTYTIGSGNTATKYEATYNLEQFRLGYNIILRPK